MSESKHIQDSDGKMVKYGTPEEDIIASETRKRRAKRIKPKKENKKNDKKGG